MGWPLIVASVIGALGAGKASHDNRKGAEALAKSQEAAERQKAKNIQIAYEKQKRELAEKEIKRDQGLIDPQLNPVKELVNNTPIIVFVGIGLLALVLLVRNK